MVGAQPVPALVNMVVEVIHPTHIADGKTAAGDEFLRNPDLVEQIRRALVHMGVGDVLAQRLPALDVVGMEQRRIARAAVVRDFAGPFGGMKMSGLGRELGQTGFDEFCQVKHVHWDIEVV